MEGINELIGIRFATLFAFVHLLAGTAEAAASPFPGMLLGRVADVSLLVGEGSADGVASVGPLAAIEAAAGEQGGQLRDGQAEELAGHDVVHPLLHVGDLRSQAHY